MIPVSEFKRMLKIENELIVKQTAGLSQADTLIQPSPSGNCMNWVLGHLLESQIIMLEMLGGLSPLPQSDLKRYERESEPILHEEPGVLSVDTLLAGLEKLHQSITVRLDEMDEADFVQEIKIGERTRTRGWQVFFLHFHYTYHLGQLELLRQLTGRTDKII